VDHIGLFQRLNLVP
jgi:hypothetical protein